MWCEVKQPPHKEYQEEIKTLPHHTNICLFVLDNHKPRFSHVMSFTKWLKKSILTKSIQFGIKLYQVNCPFFNWFTKLNPREVPWVLNLFPRELIEGPPQDFRKANLRPHQRPDPRPKTRGAADPEGFWPRVWPKMRQRVCMRKILRGAFNQLPREQIENSRDFPRV